MEPETLRILHAAIDQENAEGWLGASIERYEDLGDRFLAAGRITGRLRGTDVLAEQEICALLDTRDPEGRSAGATAWRATRSSPPPG